MNQGFLVEESAPDKTLAGEANILTQADRGIGLRGGLGPRAHQDDHALSGSGEGPLYGGGAGGLSMRIGPRQAAGPARAH